MFMNSEPENNFILALYTLRIKNVALHFRVFQIYFWKRSENAHERNPAIILFRTTKKEKASVFRKWKKAFLKTQ